MDYFKKYTFSKCLLRTLPTPFYLFSKKGPIDSDTAKLLWHAKILVLAKPW